MNELLKRLIAQWGIVEACKMINQIVSPHEYFGEKFFSSREGKYADNIVIPIMRGNSIIMEAIPSGADRPQSSDDSIHKLNVELARFADSKVITVKDLKHLMSFDDPEKQATAFATIIGQKTGIMKNKFTATKEYMRLGAIFGHVKDGSGKTLFKFKDEDVNPLALSKDVNPESVFEQYEDDLTAEFGYVPKYEMMVDRTMYNGIFQYATDKNLVSKNIVKKVTDTNGQTIIDYNGKTVRAVTNAYPDRFGNTRKFLENGKGILVPLETDAFKEFYTHAEHMDAIDGEPEEYFAKVSEKKDGSGVDLIAESVCIPINTRPYSVRETSWS